MKKANFFIVGKQKSGTTALHSFLAQHPDIFMTEPKEPMFFCTDMHKASDEFYGRQKYFPYRSEQQFSALFSKCQDQKVIGESTTQYLDSEVAAQNLFRYNKDAKIIILLREPVDYLYSLHSQYLYTFVEDIEDFKEALTAEKERKQGRRIPKTAMCPRWLFYSESIKYTEQIKRYLSLFAKKNIKIILFDDFQKDNEGVFKEVLQFLGVDDSFTPSFERINANKAVRFKGLKQVMDSPIIWSLPKKVLPSIVYAKIKNAVYILLVKKSPRKELDSVLRRELMIKFKPEVEQLSLLLQRDLVKEWSYDQI